MATLKDIITGDVEQLAKQTEAQRKVEHMNLVKKVKKDRKLVGTADSLEGAKFVGKGLVDVAMYQDSKGVYHVWASYGFITCEFNPYTAFERVGLAQGKFEFVNVISQPPLPIETMEDIEAILDLIRAGKMKADGLAEKIASIVGFPVLFEVWGIL